MTFVLKIVCLLIKTSCPFRLREILRIPNSYDAKIAEICNLWTFWPVIQLISNDGNIQRNVGEGSDFGRIHSR